MPFKRFTSKFLEIFLMLALSIMLALVFLNVILRYFFHSGISASEEISRFLFVWLTFIGALLALRDNDHLGVDMLTRRLPSIGKFICAIAAHLLMLGCCITFLIGSINQTIINMSTEMPVTSMPVGLTYAAGIVCAASMSIILLQRLARIVLARLREGKQP